jgi:hypothetical protein
MKDNRTTRSRTSRAPRAEAPPFTPRPHAASSGRTGAEEKRLRDARDAGVPWRKWGPYLSERQWGTVREDYSNNGDAWSYFSHDQARSRAYRWGEDGLAGFCDNGMRLCFSVALWNGNDPILKERLFGLTPAEGNHGQDVKEYYYYLDATPTTSYAKMLYKYPHAAFPYEALIQLNRSRGPDEPECELIETGVFKDNRYFDVFVEYAKETPEDILIRITVVNRGPETAVIHVLPQLWFRNTWWQRPGSPVPRLMLEQSRASSPVIIADHPELGLRYLHCPSAAAMLFTQNETNVERLFGVSNRSHHVKDGINDFVVLGRRDAVNSEHTGTKAAALHHLSIGPGASETIRLRLTDVMLSRHDLNGPAIDAIFAKRRREADEFYGAIFPAAAGPDKVAMMRQGFAGLLWSKQVYIYQVNSWLKERSLASEDGPVPIRNSQWFHFDSHDVLSVPDKWEFPWFSAWELAFQTVPFTLIDPDFASQQFELVLREGYQNPDGQLPGTEQNFDEVHPPIHAWAALFNYRLSRRTSGRRALEELKGSFHKLLLNFAWWINRKDVRGRNIFEGGFLDVDNVGVFDRRIPLPQGGHLEQADGTAWMAFFAQNMLAISLELALHERVYEDMAIRFYEYFVLIASVMGRLGDAGDAMWDEADGFFYNVLRLPNGDTRRLKIRSMIGLLPLCAATVYPREVITRLPRFMERLRWFEENRPNLIACTNSSRKPGVKGRYLLGILDEVRLRRVLARMLDPNEFLSSHGIRSLSRYHLENPCVFEVGGKEYRVGYAPGEPDSCTSEGNANWRGPIWMPENGLIIRALLHMYTYYGNDFTVECPTGSGHWLNLFEVARELVGRLARIFLRDKNGQRPVYGDNTTFQNDPNWNSYFTFHQYFHGDTGKGLGASHQTGWTVLAPFFLYLFESMDADQVLNEGLSSVMSILHPPPPAAPGRPPHGRPAHTPPRGDSFVKTARPQLTRTKRKYAKSQTTKENSGRLHRHGPAARSHRM